MDRSEGALGRYHRAAGRFTIVEHPRRVDLAAFARRIEAWLNAKGFETVASETEGAYRIRAQRPATWKTTIGASPFVEVEIAPAPKGTRIDVHLGKASGGEWAARFFTYSWVALGVSYAQFKSELLQFAREELGSAGGVTTERHRDPVARPCKPAAARRIVGVVETVRVEQPLGSEERVIDNTNSDTTVTRTIKATRRWTQTCQLGIENSRVSGQDTGVSLPNLVSFRQSMEKTLHDQYSSSATVEQVFEEEVTVTVPERTSLRLVMDWKRIVQEGHLQLEGDEGLTIEVPFAVALGLTFDQRQIGTTAREIP